MKLEKRTEDLTVVRNEGLVPGIIYGHGIETTPVKANYKDIVDAFHNNGLSMSFKMDFNGKKHIVYFKEFQRDALKPNEILHFDLMRVNADDTMHASIPVHLIGREEIEKSGYVVQLLADSLEYEFPVSKGISHIDVDISNLTVDDSVIASQVDVPEGFELQEESDKIIVNISHPMMETEDDDEDEEREVEIITEVKKED